MSPWTRPQKRKRKKKELNHFHALVPPDRLAVTLYNVPEFVHEMQFSITAEITEGEEVSYNDKL